MTRTFYNTSAVDLYTIPSFKNYLDYVNACWMLFTWAHKGTGIPGRALTLT